jgi:hypothetical protein
MRSLPEDQRNVRWLIVMPLLMLAAVSWDASKSNVALMDVFFAGAAGMLLGVGLTLRAWLGNLRE